MFKWVAGLCAIMYFTLLVFGEPPEGEEQAAVTEQVEQLKTEPGPVEEASVQTEPKIEPEVPIIIAAPAPATTPEISTESLSPAAEVITVSATAPQSEVAPAAAVIDAAVVTDDRGVGEIWKVTGSTVNLRSGATTQAAVLGRTQRGDSAEVMELLDNGWAKVYILESGLEAYMAAKFLARDGQ